MDKVLMQQRRRHKGYCCVGRQRHVAVLVLLLAACCITHAAAGLPDAASNTLVAAAGASSGQHVTRSLLAQPQPGIVGDDDDFDWASGTKPNTAEPAKPKQPAQPAPAAQPAAPAPAAAKPAASSKAAEEEPLAKLPGENDAASTKQQPAAADVAKPQAAAPKQQPAAAESEPELAKLPDPEPAAATDKQELGSDKQQGTPAPAGAADKEKSAAGAAAAQQQDADAAADEPVEQGKPVADGTPAILGDHSVAATEQQGPNKPLQQQEQQQQGAQPQAAAGSDQQQQAGGSGTWAAAAKQDDVDAAGACKSWVQTFCEDVEAGGGALADCLAQHQAAADSGEGKAKLEPLSSECHEEVLQLKIWRSRSLNTNPALAKACAEDISRLCNVTWFAGLNPGSVLACLKDARTKLKPGCQKEVFRLQLDAAEDYRADEGLHAACKSDADSLCQGVKHGGGQIQACLRKQRAKLSSNCESELFRKEVQDAGDIRLSVRLFRACLPDKKQFCADVQPGQARALHCLEEHKESLSEPCRAEVDAMLERRVRDFRLDTRLKAACDSTILEMCSDLGDVPVIDTFDAAVANCLQDFREDIKDDACRAQVHKYQELAAQDIRFNPSLADACHQDREELCANVPPGSARVIRCLQNQRDKLSAACRSTLLNEEVRFSENIDFQYPMKHACSREIKQFCEEVPHGGGRVIRCLQENLKQNGFSKGCKEEVQRYQQESARDYRLNHRLFKACEKDVNAVCADACNIKEGEVCGGKVLACLSHKQEELKSSACRKEVSYLQRMGVQDFRSDMQLAEACRPDVERLCAAVEPGEGRVHKCLRSNYEQLSPACKREEVRLEAQEADNIQLNQGLMRTCAAERSLFCRDVLPGSARVFRCLAHNMANADFGGGCRNAMLAKLRRREANWRLDPPLRKACSADVQSLCAEQDASLSQDGAVKKCMIEQADSLSDGCRRELGRSMYMAFFVWQPQGILTAPCDEDVQRLCLSRVKEMAAMPGAVQLCLSEIVDAMAATQTSHRRLLAEGRAASADKGKAGDKQQPKQQTKAPQLPSSNSTLRVMPRLSEQCHQLAALAHLPQSQRTPDFAAAAFDLLEATLGRVQDATGLPTLQNGRTGAVAVSLTGWTALAGVAALVVLMMTIATWAVRQYLNPARDGYMVVKNVPPLPRF